MSLTALPTVLLNLITQFLHDGDNHQFLQTSKTAKVVVRALPRISNYTIQPNTGDMYGRYRIILVLMYDRGISQLPYQHIIQFLCKIPAADLRSMCFIWTLNIYYQSNAVADITRQICDALPTYHGVEAIRIEGWPDAKLLVKFPNITALSITVKSIQNVNYVDFPNIKTLHIPDYWPQNYYKLPAWPTVEKLITYHKIPIGYTSLRDVCVASLSQIPIELVDQLVNITTNITTESARFLKSTYRYTDQPIIDLTQYTSLQKFNIIRSDYDIIVIKCRPEVKIIHNRGPNHYTRVDF